MNHAQAEDFEPVQDRTSILLAELHRLATVALAGERKNHSLSPTDLTHEAWIRLSRQRETATWSGRSEFLSVASTMLRRILVDHARKRSARERAVALALAEIETSAGGAAVDVIELETALERLEERNARVGRVVEMRFFGGATFEEIAAALAVSLVTAKRDWEYARAFLFRELQER